MSTTSLPRIPPNADQQTLINSLNFILEELDFLLNGNIDSKNAREIGGWRVGLKQMESKDKDVGMSTDDEGVDPIRFWAGDVVTGQPAFYVTRSGKLFASNGEFVGKITAESGEIGGFTIGVSALTDTAGKFGLSSAETAGDDVRFYAGGTDPAAAPFRVTESGKATASNLDITGGSINVASDVTVGKKLFLPGTDYLNGIYWNGTSMQMYIDPAGNSIHIQATGGVYANGKRLDV